ncbi:hypothetical protein [Flaviaesturariibacter amylovorans]|uniref:DUF4034 domain-containing protein n=1 Tax=Flaviaesturariibacter amylovorans TaxID=1084520 RepID=A0ABP8G7R9_9BACT
MSRKPNPAPALALLLTLAGFTAGAQGYISPFVYSNGGFRMKGREEIRREEYNIKQARNATPPKTYTPPPVGRTTRTEKNEPAPVVRITPEDRVQNLIWALMHEKGSTQELVEKYAFEIELVYARLPYKEEKYNTMAVFLGALLQEPARYDEAVRFWTHYAKCRQADISAELQFEALKKIPPERRAVGWLSEVVAVAARNEGYSLGTAYSWTTVIDDYLRWAETSGDAIELYLLSTPEINGNYSIKRFLDTHPGIVPDYTALAGAGKPLFPAAPPEGDKKKIHEEREAAAREIVRVWAKARSAEAGYAAELVAKLKKLAPPQGALTYFQNNKKEYTKTYNGEKSVQPFSEEGLAFARKCFAEVGYERGKLLSADILMAAAAPDRKSAHQYLETWTPAELARQWSQGSPDIDRDDRFYPSYPEYFIMYLNVMETGGKYQQVVDLLALLPKEQLYQYGEQYVVNLAILGRLKEADEWLDAHGKHIRYESNELSVRAILSFFSGNFKKSWKQLTSPKNGRHSGSRYSYVYYCCASEMGDEEAKKARYWTLPLYAPPAIAQKYGHLFSNGSSK